MSAAPDLRTEIAELRREVAQLTALLRTSLERRRKKVERTATPVEAPPEVRKSVRDKLVRSAARRRK